MNRGYFGIGVYRPKTIENIGTLWRSASQLGASFIFTIGKRYKKQSSDTLKTWRHIPLMYLESIEDLKVYNCHRVFIEMGEKSENLISFKHPKRCIYVLGAEDDGLPPKVLNGSKVIKIPSVKTESYNVAVAGSIVMYDRYLKWYVGKQLENSRLVLNKTFK